MKVHTYEQAFVWLGGTVLVACLLALTYGSLGLGIHLPTRAGTIDPQAVSTTPPFDRPGLHQVGPNQYEAVMIGRVWSFTPGRIEVPVGAEVTFVLTSADVIHGFNVQGTRVNMMLIPGQVTRNRYRFDRAGEYTIICHEYCGIGHHTMYGAVVVK